MSSICITSCVSDARIPLRANYVNLYKYSPEFTDAEFVKTAETRCHGEAAGLLSQPRVVNSVSRRQMYLRSYTFSKKAETMPERTKKCFGKFSQRVAITKKRRGGSSSRIRSRGGNKGMVRMKKASLSAAFTAIVQKMLPCTATVDVGEDF